jgi:hypothetical protein
MDVIAWQKLSIIFVLNMISRACKLEHRIGTDIGIKIGFIATSKVSSSNVP